MKNTVIITAEITSVVNNGATLYDEHEIAKNLKMELDADDVVVTKVQVFEGTDGGKE